MVTKVTNEQIEIFRSTAEQYLRNADKDSYVFEPIDKLFKKLKKKHEHYDDKRRDIRRAHAMVDPKTKKLMMNGDKFEYTAEALGKVEKELRDLQYKEVEIRPIYVSEDKLPDSFKFEFQNQFGSIGVVSDYEVRNAFTGFVIEPSLELSDEEEEEEELQEAQS